MLGERDADGEDAARDHVTTRATINVAGETLQVMLKFHVFFAKILRHAAVDFFRRAYDRI